MEVLVDPSTHSGDLQVAAMLALGFCPVGEASTDPMTAADALGLPLRGIPREACLSPENQLAFVWNDFAPGAIRKRADTSPALQAQAARTLVRLLGHLNPTEARRWKRTVWARFSEDLGSQERNPWLVQSILTSLGSLGDADRDSVDEEIRLTLDRWSRGLEVEARALALLALGQIGGRRGQGLEPLYRMAEVRSRLVEELVEGPQDSRPWAALALGIQGRQLVDQKRTLHQGANRQVLRALQARDSSIEAGPVVLAMGLRRDREARSALDNLLRAEPDPEDLVFACLASGVWKDACLIEPLQEVFSKGNQDPSVYLAAAKALGALGDKELVDHLIRKHYAQARDLAGRHTVLQALGQVGDARAPDFLLERLDDDSISEETRVLVIEALGAICDRRLLPWNTVFLEDLNPSCIPPGLSCPAGTGLLDRF